MLDILHPRHASALRAAHRAPHQALPGSLALGGDGGREGTGRKVGTASAQDHRGRGGREGSAGPDRWNALKPWVPAMHLLVNDSAFWEEQVRAPANAWMASGGRGAPRTPEENYVNVLAGAHAADEENSPTRKRTTKDRRLAKKAKVQAEKEELKRLRAAASSSTTRADGKGGGQDAGLKTKDQGGLDLCFSWDSKKGPCAECLPGEACKGKVKRAHNCRVLLHTSFAVGRPSDAFRALP
eukprot:s4095_g8.t1